MRSFVVILGAASVIATGVALAPSGTAAPAAHHFRNCTDMHKTYKGGVERKGAHDHRSSGHAKYAPHVSTALYNANKSSDRDKDGIACEQ